MPLSAPTPRRRPSHARPIAAAASLLAIGLVSGVALGQEDASSADAGDVSLLDATADPAVVPPMPERPRTAYSVLTRYVYQDSSSIAGSTGRAGVQRAGLDFGVRHQVNDDFAWSFGIEYDLDAFDFDNNNVFQDTWSDIHTVAASMRFSWKMDDNWTMFAGPVLGYAGESGADFSDSIYGGGFVGAIWTPEDNLTLGFGGGLVSEIEDDMRFVPIIIVDWAITDDLRLSTRTASRVTGSTAIELVWEGTPDWEFAVGTQFFYEKRFRLDGEGGAPDAVAEEENDGVYVRATYQPTPRFSVTGFAGIALDPTFRLENSSGDFLRERNLDETFVLGAALSVRF